MDIVVDDIKQGKVHKTDSIRDFNVIRLKVVRPHVDSSAYIRWKDIKDDFIPVLLMLEKHWEVEQVLVKLWTSSLLTFSNVYLSTLTKDRFDDDSKIESMFIIINGDKGAGMFGEISRRFRKWINI